MDDGVTEVATANVGSGKGITNFNFDEYGLKLIIDPSDIEVNKKIR